MSPWVTALDLVAVLAALVAIVLVALAARRRLLLRGGGTIDCSLRLTPRRRGLGWALGVGRYTEDELQWFRVFSFAPRPRRVLSRRALTIRHRRRPSGPEAFALAPGMVVIECDATDGPVELAMSEPALTGFLAWLESAPPGRYLRT